MFLLDVDILFFKKTSQNSKSNELIEWLMFQMQIFVKKSMADGTFSSQFLIVNEYINESVSGPFEEAIFEKKSDKSTF